MINPNGNETLPEIKAQPFHNAQQQKVTDTLAIMKCNVDRLCS